MKTYDEPVSFCHRCGLFNDEAKYVKWSNVMDATISTRVIISDVSFNINNNEFCVNI